MCVHSYGVCPPPSPSALGRLVEEVAELRVRLADQTQQQLTNRRWGTCCSSLPSHPLTAGVWLCAPPSHPLTAGVWLCAPPTSRRLYSRYSRKMDTHEDRFASVQCRSPAAAEVARLRETLAGLAEKSESHPLTP